ncbi:MAG: type III secretion inner membrane ring lipoprotein SctJ [Simkaniaceae bacterium]|nr:type III secretion inner membrane ring lipoprotein SctJ [Candidatus Sacchlamyda saccharinae]
MKSIWKCFLFLSLVFLVGCEKQMTIVNDVPEREANEIIVFLSSKGIEAVKVQSTTSGAPGAEAEGVKWNIAVEEKQEVEAMAILTRNGLPRKKAVNLLEIFAKSGLISSDKEENIRYQAGLAAQIAGTIRKIDGVVDANVELSIPQETGITVPGGEAQEKKRITAAVFVKHNGILDDPNSHLVTKIKRLLAGSVAGLDINDVTVISDRSRFADISLDESSEEITPRAKEYVSIWSIVMSKGSASRFRALFFVLVFVMIAFAMICGWMFWKFYPQLRKHGLKKLFSPVPFKKTEEKEEQPPSEAP